MSQDQKQVSPLPREHIPGYRPLLVRSDVRLMLDQFRSELGLQRESHIDRALVTALMQLVISERSLHGRLPDLLRNALKRDAELVVGSTLVARETGG